MSWATLEADLRRWHELRDQDALRRALTFLETEMRLRMPPIVRRTWAREDQEDAIQDFLVRRMEHPLPKDIVDLRSYMVRAFRNHCIDRQEARRRRREVSDQAMPAELQAFAEGSEPPAEAIARREDTQRVRRALQQLEIGDRVALKLDLAPEWLDDGEVAWLARKCGRSPEEVRRTVAAADDVFALTRIFDPVDDDPADPEARRKRMERFRRRRARALEKLRELLPEVP